MIYTCDLNLMYIHHSPLPPFLSRSLLPFVPPPLYSSLSLSQHLNSLDLHTMLSSYHKHWLSYQQGAKFLHNLFAYFNRVSLRKYQQTDLDNSLEAILGTQRSTASSSPGTPLEIRDVSMCPRTYIRTFT